MTIQTKLPAGDATDAMDACDAATKQEVSDPGVMPITVAPPDNAPIQIPDLSMAHMSGEQAAAAALDKVCHYYAHPDELYWALLPLIPKKLGVERMTNIRGFLRAIQKHLERK
ncbi:hypothetical protein ABC383_07220 [Noviherbaspirillum sp. 1P10PC]|uniref:hypothetical protein n=1 Tax=Noviherbaspirillum sp. 1P10PC TaxID=3132292 RepID=UPI0039A1C0E4